MQQNDKRFEQTLERLLDQESKEKIKRGKLLSNFVIFGGFTGTSIAIAGQYLEKEFMKGVGYGITIGVASVGLMIITDYFSKVYTKRKDWYR